MEGKTGRIVGVLGVVLLTACGDPTGPGDSIAPIDDLPRPLTDTETLVVERSNAFGIELIREVAERDEQPNIVLSPLSASMALGMTLTGAAGETFDEIRTALSFGDLERSEINASYAGLLDLLVDLDPAVEVAIANSAWANEAYPFHAAFFDAIGQHFQATAETRDFGDPATLAAINGWVEEKTAGHIERILEEGQLDPQLALLLLNAVYFDAPWRTAFDPDETEPATFTRVDGQEVPVQMMRLRGEELPFAGTETVTAVELPYGGGAYSMIVAVPHRNRTVREVLSGADGAWWDALVDGLVKQEVDLVGLPRFELSYDVILNDPLSAMGMPGAFRSAADFSDLSPEPLCIDFVRQKTFVEVDEAGTTAAAVTGVGIGPTSFTGITADRPFLFAIRERLSNTILFIGVVGDPTEEEAGEVEMPGPCRFR
ncbi:MAG: serpin family protein [Gemmatimonadota bacterium]